MRRCLVDLRKRGTGSPAVRRAPVWLLFLLFGIAVPMHGCGAKHVKNKKESHPTIVTGKISLRGSSLSALLILESEDGQKYIVRASEELFKEMKRLSGMKISIAGYLSQVGSGLPILKATAYEILPLATGEVPMVGFIEALGDSCFFLSEEGPRFRIIGEFSATLREFDGAKIWIVGRKEEHGGSLRVLGYGLLKPAR